MKNLSVILVLMVFSCSTVFALANPSTVYCNEMNYTYVMQSDAQSNLHGVCIMPDGTRCDAWAFLEGTCGASFSYCAKSGYGTATVTNGSSRYATCITTSSKTKALASQSGIRVVDMMNLSAKLGSDITPRAVLTQMNQMVGTTQSSKQMYNSQSMYNATAYSSWDWRNPPANTIYASSNYPYFQGSSGWMTSVKDQGQCGSCWSFGTLGAMEAKYDLGMNESRLQPDLSEQDEVSCDHSCYYDEGYSGACQYGCSGGYPNVSLWNIQYNGGVVDENCFPYTATNNACSNICPDSSNRSWTITGSQSAGSPTNAQLEQMLIDNGPLTILVDASQWYYYGGVLTCTSPSTYMDHAVVLVGYNDTGNTSTSYWIIKNSWGSGWGENGYIRVEFGCYGVGLWAYYAKGVTPPDFKPAIVMNSPTQVYDSGPVQFNFTVNNRKAPTSTCDLLINGAIVNTTLAGNGIPTTLSYQPQFGEQVNWSIRCWETGFGIVSSTPTQNLNLYISIESPSPSPYNVSSLPLDYAAANPDTCWYSLDGNPDVMLPGCGNTTLDSLSDGIHSLVVSYNDTNGTIHYAGVNFTIDTVPPLVTLSSPADLSTSHSPTVAFNFTATDNLSSTMDCSMFLDNALNQTNAHTMNGVPTVFQISAIAYGNHTWYVACSDDAGNVGTSATSGFAVDTTIPSVTLNSPADQAVFNVSNVTFSFTATDSQSSTLDCSLFLDNVLNQTNPSTMVDTATAFQVSNIPDGSHSWLVQCTNAANNTGTSATQHFSMQTGCPVISSSGTVTMTTNFFGAPNNASPLTGSACVKITASNVVLDCNGFGITGNGSNTSYGVLIDGPITNVTVQNCQGISGYRVGIYEYEANSAYVINDGLNGNLMDGVYLYYSSNNVLSNDNVSGATNAFGLYSSSNNVVSNDIATNSSNGFNLGSGSNNNTLTNDIAQGSSNYDFTISGSGYDLLANDTAYGASNDGFAIFASNNILANDTAYGNGYYGFYLSAGTFNNLTGDSAFNNTDYGFYLYTGSANNMLANDGAYGNGYTGFVLYSGSNNNVLANDSANGNLNIGFELYFGSSNILTGDNANNNTYYGFYLYSSPNDTLTGCSANSDPSSGFYLSYTGNDTIANSAGNSSGGVVIYLALSSNDAIINTTATTDMGYGIFVDLSSNDTIADCVASSNSDEGIYLLSSSNDTIINSIGTTNSGGGIYFMSSSNNTIINSTGNASSGYGTYISSSPNNTIINSIGASNSGYGIFFYSCSSDVLANSVGISNSSPAIMLYLSSNDTVINSTGTSNSSYAIYLSGGSNNSVIGSTGASTTYPAIFLITTSNNTVLNSVAKTSSGISFYLYQSDNNNLTGDNSSGAYGFYLDNSSSNQLSNDVAFNNSNAGLLVHNTVLTIVQGMHFFKNNPDMQMQDDAGPQMALNASNLIFDNPLGNMQNYTNLSIADSLSINEAYGISWTGNPSSLPSGQSPFAQKFVNITRINSMVIISSITWSWTDAEATGHNETGFALWSYNSSGWAMLNNTPDIVANTLSLTNLVPGSYGILQGTVSVPVVNLTAPPSGALSNASSMRFSFNATDAVNGTMNCSIFIDSVQNQTNASVQNATNTVFSVSGIPDGTHTWYVACRDRSNNMGSSATRSFTVDTTAPAVALNSPPSGALLNYSTIAFSFTATDALSSTTSCALFRDGSQIGSNASVQRNTTTVISASTADGAHTWYVSCNDSAGNTGKSATSNFTVDTTAPAVTLNSPPSGALLNYSTIAFSFTATDALSSTTSCALFRDGSQIGSNASVQRNTTTIISASTPDGAHTWYVSCNDSAGNTGTSATRNLTVDTTAPIVSLNSPANASAFNTSTVAFNFTAIDNLAPLMSCSIFLDGVSSQTNASTANNTATILTLSNMANGNHAWYVQCKDNANNSGASATRSFTVNVSSPGQWANASFSSCRNITILNASGTRMANFPALVVITNTTDMQSNYYDLRFYNSSCNNGGTLLPYEIENYTATNATIWIGIPVLNAGSTTISVYFKNNTGVGSGQNASGVWNPNYMAVWHMQNANPPDSTSHADNGAGKGVALNATGKIDGALSFAGGSASYVNCSNKPSLHSGGNLTIEAWVNSKAGKVAWGKIMYKPYTSAASPYTEYGLSLDGTPSKYAFELTLNGAQDMVYSNTTAGTSTWEQVVGVYNGSAMLLYVNGTLQSSAAASGTINNYNQSLFIGSNAMQLTQSWNGTIDEVEVLNTSLSPQWISQSYKMEANTSRWVVFGAEQPKPS